MRTRPGWYVTLALTAAILGGAIFLQSRMIYRFKLEPDVYRDTMYVPSEGYLKVASLGYDQFVADFFWLRMIQIFAAGWSRPKNADQVYSFFKGITDLDPRYQPVYSFAIMAVGESGKRDDMVQEIVQKSFRNLPGHWEIPRDGAFYAFWNMNKPDLARFYIQVALNSPDVPAYLKGWVGFFAIKEGRFKMAFEKYMIDVIRGRLSDNRDFEVIYMTHLRRSVDEWYKSIIEAGIGQWQNANGSTEIPSLDQLRDAGVFKGIEVPDWTEIRQFLKSLEGRFVEASEMEIRAAIAPFIRVRDQLPAEGPYDELEAVYPGYIVWPAADQGKPFTVLTQHEGVRHLQEIYARFALGAEEYKKNHDGQCPADPAEILPLLKDFKNPFGGTISVDPETCTLRFSANPDLDQIILSAP